MWVIFINVPKTPKVSDMVGHCKAYGSTYRYTKVAVIQEWCQQSIDIV